MSSPQQARCVEALLRDLGPHLRRGGAPAEPLSRCPTGISRIDGMLDGGVPRGRLCEIAGPASSGRTALAHALLASATRAGEVAAVVDPADAFDPASAERAGAVLERVLWVRPPRWREALRSTERLLQTRGFALVLLDLDAAGTRRASGTETRANRAAAGGDTAAVPPLGAWLRLTRAAAASGTALVVLAEQRCTGTAADLAVELACSSARFNGVPALLECIETRAALVRGRGGMRDAPLHLRAS